MRHSKKRRGIPVGLIIVSVVVILVLCAVFFFPLNNALRNVTGNDTASDKVVKSELVKKVKSKKTGDSKKDAEVSQAATILGKKRMSQLMDAAKNQQKAADLIHDTSSLSQAKSEDAAKEIFSNSDYNGIRNAISNGNWYQAYSQYQKLSNNGELTELQQELGQ